MSEGEDIYLNQLSFVLTVDLILWELKFHLQEGPSVNHNPDSADDCLH